MRGIKSYTDAFKASEKQKLDYLIMSQGVMNLDGRNETPEGIDRKMAVHYYGRQMLIRELLPSLTPDAKVISVYDSWSGNPSKLSWDDLDLKKNFSLGTAANHCMVMNDVMVQHFATTQNPNDKRHFVHAWPGAVNTNLVRELPWYLRSPLKALANVISTNPDVWAERLLNGLKERVEEGEKGGKLWHYLNQKGLRVKDKTVWTEEEMGIIAGHTWNLVDSALLTKA